MAIRTLKKQTLIKKKTKIEQSRFKQLIFQKRGNITRVLMKNSLCIKSTSKSNPEETSAIKRGHNGFTAKFSWEPLLFPNIVFLLYLLSILPANVACVAQCFSEMKLIKTYFWNQTADVQLDMLSRIATESTTGYYDTIY